MNLTASQAAALKYIETYARELRTVGQDELANVLAMSNIAKASGVIAGTFWAQQFS